MKYTANTTRLLLALTLLLCAPLAGADDSSRTFEGDYEWEQRERGGDLKAVFTPTAENAWEVAFHFRFRGEQHVYEGTAEGSLSEGELKGAVKNESKKRTFTFQGAFEDDGRFRGTHAEIRSDNERRTGTLQLRESGTAEPVTEPTEPVAR